MATQLKTKTSELGDSRVRVEVEVEPAAVDRALSQAAANLGRDLKIPGFRKGKVPAQVVLQRVGREAGRREPEVPQDEVDAEIERLREQSASLDNVERPAQKGDFVVIDFVGRV